MHRLENQLPAPWEPNFKEELEKYKRENKNWETEGLSEVKSDRDVSDENGEDEGSCDDSDKENEGNYDFTATENVDIDVDEELKKCEEKLCQNSVDFSLIVDSLKSDVEELSFYGW